MKNLNKLMAAAGMWFLVGGAKADIFIVGNNNLDTQVANEGAYSSQTEGVKNGLGENNGNNGFNNLPGTTLGSDPGALAYWQGFKTGPSGNIELLSLDLTVLASSPGQNKSVSNPDTATFYLYTFPNAEITQGQQVGSAIATVTAAEIEGGTMAGYSANNSSDIYQYNLISSPSSYHLAANTSYAIVMMTSGASNTKGAGTAGSTAAQDVGWAESNTEATGDMGEFDKINTSGNNGGAYGQMEIAIVPEPTTLIAGALLLLPFGASTLRILRRRQAA